MWGIYIALNAVFRESNEAYFSTYLLTFFLVAFSLLYFLKNNVLHSSSLYLSLTLIGVVESIVTLLQYLHLIGSHSTLFAVTGTTDNPNITAMAITLSLPACIALTRQLKKPLQYLTAPFWGMIVAALLILQCRSALLGAVVVALVYGIVYIRPGMTKGKIAYFLIAVLCVAGAIAVTLHLNHTKQASADSRLTIWKVSGEMIANKPFTGYGYGLFQREYNLQQAAYFNRALRPETERMNAGYTAMAYNEYLEHTVMGGLPGGLLFTGTLLVLLWSGWRKRKEAAAALAGMAAFAIMSFLNFTVESPFLFFAFIVYAVILLPGKGPSKEGKFDYPRRLVLAGSLVGVIFLFVSVQKYNAQKQLKIARDLIQARDYRSAEKIINEIEGDISTSEAFYRTKADLLSGKQQYEAARRSMEQALEYTSSTSKLLISARLAEMTGDYTSAEMRYRLVCGMEPHLFRPRALLMRMYDRMGNTPKSRLVAQEILSLKPKIPSKEVIEYKREARRISERDFKTHSE